MRIAFTSFYEKPSMGGGPGVITHELPKFFSKEHDVLFICPGQKNKLVKVNKSLKIAYISSEKGKEISIPFLSVPNVFHIFKTLSEFKPDVIHSQDFDPISLISQIWAIVHNVTFFHTIHVFPGKRSEFGISEASKTFSKFYSSNLISHYVMNYFNNTDALITLNQHVEENVRDFGYTGKTFIIPNGLDFSNFKNCKPTNLKSKKKELLFVGFLTRRKNQIYLINMMKFLPENYHLTLIGDALNRSYKDEIIKYLHENKLESKVTLKKKLPHQEVINYLKKTHVFTSASTMELQSLVILEALASGTPIVGLYNETIDELIDNSVGIKLSNDVSYQKFAEKVRNICELSEKDYLELFQNAKDKVRPLDWKNISKQIVLAYQETIKNKIQRNKKLRFKMVDRIIPIFKDLLLVRYLREYIRKFMSYLPFDKDKKGELELKPYKLQKKKLLDLKWQYLYLLIAIISTVSGFFTLRLIRNTKRIKNNLKKI